MRVLDNIKKLEENGTEKPHVNKKFCSLSKNLLTELSVSLFAHLTKKQAAITSLQVVKRSAIIAG